MQINEKQMSLENIAEGAIVERFNLALGEILSNIQDPNTEAEEVRSISISVKIKPDERRQVAFVGVEVVPKPAKYKPIITKAVFETDLHGDHVANELQVPQQMIIPFKNRKG